MSAINEALYEPASSPLYESGESLCEVLRSTGCLQALCAPLAETTAATAVVHGVGGEPPDVRGWTIPDLMRIGCRAFVGPAEEDWLRVAEAGSTAQDVERYAFDVELRRIVMPLEETTLGRPRLFAWFYSQTAALPAQIKRLAAETCLVVRSVEGLLAPAFNTKDERAAQGLVMHTLLRVTVGDQDA